VCPSGARKKIGSTVTVEEVLRVIKRDAIFYRESRGGVTFSGGEPFAQPEFLRQLVLACNQLGIDTAAETSGYFDWDQVQDIFECLDCVFVDIKHMDDEAHKKLTGVSNRRILENIALISQINPKTIIRVPLMEEVNTEEQNIRRICEFLRQKTRVEEIELLPYHDFGKTKYSAVGTVSQPFTTPDATKIKEIEKIITDYGIRIIEFK
jgi:pyruvate formate lyase activating enzyme